MSGINEIKDESFFRLCSNFIKKIFSIPDLEGIVVPHQDFIGYTIPLIKLEELLIDDVDYKEIIKYMKENEVYSKQIDTLVGIPVYSMRRTCWDYISFLIREQLYFNNGKFILNKEKLIKDYEILENFFYNDKIEMRVSLRLINFKMEDIEEIDLGNNIKIKIMEFRDTRLFIDQRYMHPHSQYIIDTVYEEEKILGENFGKKKPSMDSYSKAANPLYQVINFLRIFKEGDIKAGGIYRTSLHNIIEIGASQVSGISPYATINAYTISSSELDELKSYWDEYKKLDVTKYKEFFSSLRRLGYAMERDRYGDRLIDLVIAMESLFYASGESGELTYRLRLRLSKLLEESAEKRKKIADNMRSIYDIRSRIVHGGKDKIAMGPVKECEELLRRALTKYLVLRKEMSHGSLIRKLDYAY